MYLHNIHENPTPIIKAPSFTALSRDTPNPCWHQHVADAAGQGQAKFEANGLNLRWAWRLLFEVLELASRWGLRLGCRVKERMS